MPASDDAHPKRWLDGDTPQDHVRDALNLLAGVMLANDWTFDPATQDASLGRMPHGWFDLILSALN